MAVATYMHEKEDREREQEYTEEHKREVGCFTMLQLGLCFICPPLAVFLERGLDVDFILCLCLTAIVWLPGALWALYLVKKYELDPIVPNTLEKPSSTEGLTFDRVIASAKDERRARYPPMQQNDDGLDRVPPYRSRSSRMTAPPQYSTDEDSDPDRDDLDREKRRAVSGGDHRDWRYDEKSRREMEGRV